MNKILVVVNMQNDFIYGVLSNEQTKAVVEPICRKVKKALEDGDYVIFTRDTHFLWYLDTVEGKHLPILHCIQETEGWEIIDELQEYLDHNNVLIQDKNTFGAYFLGEDIADFVNSDGKIDKPIELCGVCTDVCVISNVMILKSYFTWSEIYVDASACAGTNPEAHNTALTAMKQCHINIIGK